MSEKDLKDIEKTIKALADKNRLRIICLLNERPDLCVCEITNIIGLSQPTISSHLRLLENARLVESDKDGLWVNYSLKGPLDPLSKDIVETISRDLKSDKQVLSDLESLKSINRDKICSNSRK